MHQAPRIPADNPAPAGRGGKNSSFFMSLRHAARGLAVNFRTERNFRIELALGGLALILAALLGFDRTEWLVLVLNIALILAFEVKNTVSEITIDLHTRDFNHHARRAKDSAAGAVLVMALASLVNGVLLYGPHLLELAVQAGLIRP